LPRLNRDEEIISRILSRFKRQWRRLSDDPFCSLIRIILSQNTSFKNEAMAYKQLERSIGVTPETLSKASVERIAEAIRPAGMHRRRSRTLKKVAEAVLERYGGDITSILHKPYLEARVELMGLPGVGKKTADVLLMFDAGKAIIPVDRHISRIAKRLEMVTPKASYDEIRKVLEAAADPDRYEDIHVLLIRFGRETCRAQRPLCEDCFLNDLCPYPGREEH